MAPVASYRNRNSMKPQLARFANFLALCRSQLLLLHRGLAPTLSKLVQPGHLDKGLMKLQSWASVVLTMDDAWDGVS